MKKMISWNVNGLRAAVGKNFKEVFDSLDADILHTGNKASGRSNRPGI